MQRAILVLLLILPALLCAQSSDLAVWKQSFENAEKEFNSRSQYSSVGLFQNLVQQIQQARKSRTLSQEELSLLYRSMDYLGQVYFNYNELDKTREVYAQLAALSPNYQFDEDYVSPKIVDFFEEIKKNLLAPATITSNPPEAEVRLDGTPLGTTQFSGQIAKGPHTIEVRKKGFKPQTKTVEITAGENQIQFQLDPLTGLAADISDPQMSAKYQEIQETLTRSGDKNKAGRSLEDLGAELEKSGDAENGRKVFEEVLVLYRGLSDTEGIARTTSTLATISLRQGNKDAARKYLEEAVALQKQRNDSKGVALLSVRLADLSFEQGNLDAAKSQYQSSLTYLRENNEKALLASAFFQMGEIASSQKNMKEALEYYRDAKNIYQELGDANGVQRAEAGSNKLLDNSKYEIAGVLGRASTLMGQRNNREAEAKFQEGLALAQTVGDKRNMMIALVNLGFLYNLRSDPASEKTYEQGLALARELDDKNNMAICLLGIGIHFFNRQDLAGAQVRYQEALDVSKKGGQKRNEALALYNLANTVYMLGNQGEANRLYEESAVIYKQLGETPRQRMW